MAYTDDLTQKVKTLLRFDDDFYDDELTIYIASVIELMKQQGITTPTDVTGSDLFTVCVAYRCALNLESLNISQTRIDQLEAMYFQSIVMLKNAG